MVLKSITLVSVSMFGLLASYAPALASCCEMALECCNGGACCM